MAQPSVAGSVAQAAQAQDSRDSDRPLPDIPALMHQVEVNQQQAERIEKTYIYHSVETMHEQGSGGAEKVTTTEADHFWMNGVPVRRELRKNGRDLSADELEKQDRRIEKESKQAHDRREKTEAEGKESDPEGREEITVSRLLQLGAFTNPRRVLLNGRDTIAVDYTGEPQAKTRNRAEEVIRDMAGTAWIDEQDKVLVRADGRFARPFKVGAGLLISIRQGTSFSFQQTKVNSEVWLPSTIEAQGAARAMLFVAFAGKMEVVDSDYRKFRTSTTIIPVTSPEPAEPTPPVDNQRR